MAVVKIQAKIRMNGMKDYPLGDFEIEEDEVSGLMSRWDEVVNRLIPYRIDRIWELVLTKL